MSELSPTSPVSLASVSGGRLRIGRWRLSAKELLAALVMLFFVAPFVQDLPHGEFIEGLLMSLVLLSAIAAVGGRRRTLIAAVCLAAPAIIGKWVHHFCPEQYPFPLYLIAALAFLAFVIVHLLRFVLRARVVNTEVLCASIAAYLTMGLLWAMAYLLTWFANPQSFAFNVPSEHSGMDGFNAFYFSFVTLSTVGYGDITPISKVARMLAIMEAIIGLLYVAVLIARLVSLYSIPPVSEDREPSRDER
jgi:voltage-gated potassium channel